jgi:hypothetical protein
LASSIPINELIFTKCDFFLDTIFLGFYTFVNCKVSLAGSMSTRQRENRNNGNQESSSKEASEEGSQENSKEEVSRQRNRQHNRGTPKASPDVFLEKAGSSVFMRLRGGLGSAGEFTAGAEIENCGGLHFVIERMAASLPGLIFPRFTARQARRFTAACGHVGHLLSPPTRSGRAGHGRGPKDRQTSLPKWYWDITPSDEALQR